VHPIGWWRIHAPAVHDAPVIGRLLAVCGWLAWQVGRPFRSRRLRRAAPIVAAAILALAGLAVIIVPQLDPQPADLEVQALFDGAATDPGTWIRLDGRLVPLTEAPTDAAGSYGLLVDAANHLRSIVVRADGPITPTERTSVTGRVAEAPVIVEEDLPIEATVAGTPPRVIPDRLVELDPVSKPARVVWWPLALLPALLAGLLVIGWRVGYPIFRPTSVVDVLAAPLAPGERLPAAYGGRVGPNRSDLADPGAALLLVRRGPQGNLLTAQPLPDDGQVAPPPVTIGGGWTNGRIGDVHTVSETVPALRVRSELVDATFLFSRTAERDRVAALITVDR
jgi:hypothetical protein